jgi:hypothetical protein
MKKIILIASLMTAAGGLSAFGQGYFQFTTAKSQVWDGFSTGAPHVANDVNIAFLWGAQGAVPQVESILNGVPTTATPANSTWLPGEAWAEILTDPNFTLAVNSGAGNSLVSVLCTSTGAVNYNGGSAFAGPLTTVPTGVYTLFMIGWDSAYATPALAAAAGSVVGWSAPYNYTATAMTATPNSMSGLTPAFGVVGMIPEPATLALAGLGGLTLWFFRRRK